ncbi:transglycosylase domain-containing protein [Streptomyces sp. NPDC058459]|uniref:transglycosylase domain-containing protein n=1 Tax=Streptomyces sp. NPDC058459 TaxID=3346508 RepID=UPI003665EFF7
MTEAGRGGDGGRRGRGRRAAPKQAWGRRSQGPDREAGHQPEESPDGPAFEPEATMQLRVGMISPDETMQLKIVALDGLRPAPKPEPALPEEPAGARPPGLLAPLLTALAELRRLLAPFTARLAPYAGRVAPYARKLRPEYPRPGREGWRRWVPSWRQVIAGWLATIGLTGLFLTVAYAATDVPTNLNSYATQQDNVYFWADGTPMARTGWVRRQAMPLKDIPEGVRWAVLAAENESFYSDPGISAKGIARALWRTVGEGATEGGSTITQQYVKNVYLNQDQNLGRKLTEAMISLKLDNRMSKDKILEGYLNTSWFGRGTYGIQRASQSYYGKDVSKLNPSEAAMLASLLKGAGLYDPTLNAASHHRAVERWSYILDRMVKIGKLSPAERAKYTKFPEPIKTLQIYDTGKQSDYLVELASQYAKKSAHLSAKEFDLGGYQIYTTFDRKRESELTEAVTKAREAALKKDPEGARTAHYGAASVATDGRIVAVYGGPDHRKQGYNESNATTVPAGSAFTPFVYAAALEHGVHKTREGPATPVTPETVYDGNDAVPVTTPEGPYWDRSGHKVSAHNDGNRSYGPISLRQALARSVDTPFMQLGMDTGLEQVKSTAQAAGLLSASFGPSTPTLSLGTSTPSTIRMASGYATFAADGRHTEPYSVRRVTRNGAGVRLDAPDRRMAVGPGVARQVSEALTDNFRLSHPAPAATAPAAGKNGTTDKDTALWYTGTLKSVSTAIVVYRIDLGRSLEPLPLDGLAGTRENSVPYGIWSRAVGVG